MSVRDENILQKSQIQSLQESNEKSIELVTEVESKHDSLKSSIKNLEELNDSFIFF